MSRKYVTLNVNRDFYDRILQRERIKFSKMLGIQLTNTKFTEFLSKNNVQFKLPKLQGAMIIPSKRRRNNIWTSI